MRFRRVVDITPVPNKCPRVFPLPHTTSSPILRVQRSLDPSNNRTLIPYKVTARCPPKLNTTAAVLAVKPSNTAELAENKLNLTIILFVKACTSECTILMPTYAQAALTVAESLIPR
jgi:hypothetical protein